MRWRNKKRQISNPSTCGKPDRYAQRNNISEMPGSSNQSPLTLDEATVAHSSQVCRPKRSLHTHRQGRPPKTGRGVLQFVPLTVGTLPPTKHCSHCGAVSFYSEPKNFCCSSGRVVLTSNELPVAITQLLTSTSEKGKAFRTYIRSYNNLFAFTSLGVKSDTNISRRNNGIYTLRVQGQVYHFINDLLPEQNGAKNLQLYFHDTDHELQNRLANCERLTEQAIKICMNTLRQNPYACFFRSLKDISQLESYKIVLKTSPSQDQRVYNKPEVSQIAALWVDGDENVEYTHRNIEVKTHSNQSRKIDYYYGCYDPLQYPLTFPFGELGWHQGILKRVAPQKRRRGLPDTTAAFLISPHNAESVENLLYMEEDVLAQKDDQSKFVSVREYYAYKLQIRKNDQSFLLRFGRLLQQYIVDNYVKLETQRLDFYRLQQSDIRREFLQGVVDAIGSGETEGSVVGQRILLPSSFIDGPRNMRQKYIDAMTLVQKYGKPYIFLTVTCNPNWQEIKERLMAH